jgi:hypothetical protein
MTLRQSNNSPNGKVKSKVKSMLIVLFDIKGMVHKEFVLAGQTFNSAHYCDVIQRLCENVRTFRPEFWRQNTACCITTTHRLRFPFSPGFFYQKQNDCFPQPPYFSLFPLLKIKLEGRHFDTIEVIEAELQAVLITLTEHDFQFALKNDRNSVDDA